MGRRGAGKGSASDEDLIDATFRLYQAGDLSFVSERVKQTKAAWKRARQ